MTADIVVFGSMNMDLVVRVARAPRRGETLQGLSFLTNPGGPVLPGRQRDRRQGRV